MIKITRRRYTIAWLAWSFLSTLCGLAENFPEIRIPVTSLTLKNGISTEVYITSTVDPPSRGDPEATPSRLWLECQINIGDEGERRFQVAELSRETEQKIRTNQITDQFRFFSGMLQGSRVKNRYTLIVSPPIAVEGTSIVVDLTAKEFEAIVNSVRKGILIKDAFEPNWIKLCEAWGKSRVTLDLSERSGNEAEVDH